MYNLLFINVLATVVFKEYGCFLGWRNEKEGHPVNVPWWHGPTSDQGRYISTIVPYPFAVIQCNKICSNQIRGSIFPRGDNSKIHQQHMKIFSWTTRPISTQSIQGKRGFKIFKVMALPFCKGRYNNINQPVCIIICSLIGNVSHVSDVIHDLLIIRSYRQLSKELNINGKSTLARTVLKIHVYNFCFSLERNDH